MGAEPKIPKPVQRARELLQAHGLDSTAANLWKVLPKEELNKLTGAFRSSLNDEAKVGYQQLGTDAEKRGWIAQYVMDPQVAVCNGFNKTTAFVSESRKGTSSWKTEKQIAAVLKSDDDAKLLCESGDLKDRPHEFASLAAKGLKQYYYTADEHLAEAGTIKESGVQAKAELTPMQFQEVKEDIANNFGKAGKRKTSRPVKAPESEASKRLRAAVATRASSLKQLKGLNDKTQVELESAESVLPKLVMKGYPEQMEIFLASKVNEAKDWLNDSKHAYAVEIMKPDPKSHGNLDLVQGEFQRLSSVTQNLDENFQKFKKCAGADIKKLTT